MTLKPGLRVLGDMSHPFRPLGASFDTQSMRVQTTSPRASISLQTSAHLRTTEHLRTIVRSAPTAGPRLSPTSRSNGPVDNSYRWGEGINVNYPEVADFYNVLANVDISTASTSEASTPSDPRTPLGDPRAALEDSHMRYHDSRRTASAASHPPFSVLNPSYDHQFTFSGQRHTSSGPATSSQLITSSESAHVTNPDVLHQNLADPIDHNRSRDRHVYENGDHENQHARRVGDNQSAHSVQVAGLAPGPHTGGCTPGMQTRGPAHELQAHRLAHEPQAHATAPEMQTRGIGNVLQPRDRMDETQGRGLALAMQTRCLAPETQSHNLVLENRVLQHLVRTAQTESDELRRGNEELRRDLDQAQRNFDDTSREASDFLNHNIELREGYESLKRRVDADWLALAIVIPDITDERLRGILTDIADRLFAYGGERIMPGPLPSSHLPLPPSRSTLDPPSSHPLPFSRLAPDQPPAAPNHVSLPAAPSSRPRAPPLLIHVEPARSRTSRTSENIYAARVEPTRMPSLPFDHIPSDHVTSAHALSIGTPRALPSVNIAATHDDGITANSSSSFTTTVRPPHSGAVLRGGILQRLRRSLRDRDQRVRTNATRPENIQHAQSVRYSAPCDMPQALHATHLANAAHRQYTPIKYQDLVGYVCRLEGAVDGTSGGTGPLNAAYPRTFVAVNGVPWRRHANSWDEFESAERDLITRLNVHARIPRHPNILALLDVFRDEYDRGSLVTVSEYLPVTLRQVLCSPSGYPLPQSFLSSVFIQLARGLAHLHENHIIHCAVCPENVFLAFDSHANALTVKLSGLDHAIFRDDLPADRGTNSLADVVAGRAFGMREFGERAARRPPFAADTDDFLARTDDDRRHGREGAISQGHAAGLTVGGQTADHVTSLDASPGYYHAPEMEWLRRAALTPGIDLWSLGTIAAELVLGAPLFPRFGVSAAVTRQGFRRQSSVASAATPSAMLSRPSLRVIASVMGSPDPDCVEVDAYDVVLGGGPWGEGVTHLGASFTPVDLRALLLQDAPVMLVDAIVELLRYDPTRRKHSLEDVAEYLEPLASLAPDILMTRAPALARMMDVAELEAATSSTRHYPLEAEAPRSNASHANDFEAAPPRQAAADVASRHSEGSVLFQPRDNDHRLSNSMGAISIARRGDGWSHTSHGSLSSQLAPLEENGRAPRRTHSLPEPGVSLSLEDDSFLLSPLVINRRPRDLSAAQPGVSISQDDSFLLSPLVTTRPPRDPSTARPSSSLRSGRQENGIIDTSSPRRDGRRGSLSGSLPGETRLQHSTSTFSPRRRAIREWNNGVVPGIPGSSTTSNASQWRESMTDTSSSFS